MNSWHSTVLTAFQNKVKFPQLQELLLQHTGKSNSLELSARLLFSHAYAEQVVSQLLQLQPAFLGLLTGSTGPAVL